MNWYMEVLKKYADFSGRARRTEFWMFVLFNFIISVVLSVIDHVVGLDKNGVGILRPIYALAVLVPSIAVAVRRLHDTNRSGWWILVGLVPCIGWIFLLIYYVQDSDPQPNQYGPNPKMMSM